MVAQWRGHFPAGRVFVSRHGTSATVFAASGLPRRRDGRLSYGHRSRTRGVYACAPGDRIKAGGTQTAGLACPLSPVCNSFNKNLMFKPSRSPKPSDRRAFPLLRSAKGKAAGRCGRTAPDPCQRCSPAVPGALIRPLFVSGSAPHCRLWQNPKCGRRGGPATNQPAQGLGRTRCLS
jgi:hypothetical protein